MEHRQEPGAASSWREALLASALDAIVIMDGDGIIREFNHAAQETFGYARSEAVGRTVAEVMVPPELREAHWRGLRHYLSTGEGPILSKRVEIEGQRKNGERFPVELTVVPFEADGAWLFVGYLRDLTEKKEAEAEIRRANEVAVLLREIPLQASRADSFHDAARVAIEQVCRFAHWPVGHVYVRDRERDLLIPVGIWYLEDPERFAKFREVTDQTELRLGEGLPGRAWAEDQPAWSDDIQHDVTFVRAQAAQDLGVAAGLAVPIPVGGRTEAVLEFYTAERRHPDQRLMNITETLVHHLGRVLEKQRSREQLRAANEQLAEMARRRADFLNLAAHELKNPLTPLALQLQMLPRAGPLNEEQRQSMEVIERSVGRLQEIVGDLVDGARAQSGTLPIECESTDLNTVAKAVVRAYEDTARAKGVRLEQEIAHDQITFVDPHRVAQVLDNLVSNAIKFTPHGGRIVIRAGVDDEEGFLEVDDTGEGIDPAAQKRLFQPFSQVHDRSRDLGGTGLGLYVCHAIMEAHGGRMGVQSEGPGHGSRFWARWPSQPVAC